VKPTTDFRDAGKTGLPVAGNSNERKKTTAAATAAIV
jgi:hypothetical protein